jgi:DNA modification methylase
MTMPKTKKSSSPRILKLSASLLTLDPKDISIGWRARTDLGDVSLLASSIAKDGQTQPIGVRKNGKGYELVYGLRRMRACEMLQIKVAAIQVAPEDEPHELELQLAENLARKDFDALELGEGMKRLKSIYEGKHPETVSVRKRGGPGRGKTKSDSDLVSSPAADRFTLHASRMIGCSETKVKDIMAVADLPKPVKREINKVRDSRERSKKLGDAVRSARLKRRMDKLDRTAKEKQKKREAETGRAEYLVHLYHDDNREWLKSLGNIRPFVDLILTDPPFETERQSLVSHLSRKSIKTDFGDWDKLDVGWLVAFAALLTPGGQVLANCPFEAIGDYKLACQTAGLVYRGAIVWHKTNPGTLHRPGYLSACEAICWATKGDGYYFLPWANAGAPECHNHIEGPICGGNERLGHPTQKPEWLIKRLLERHSAPKDQVLDPFAGVGTTLAVCKQRKQPCIGVERDNGYVGKAAKRLRAI